MARMSKREKRLVTYGDVQQTVPVLIPPARYHALKILAYKRGSTVNKIVRDIIEVAFKEELDQIEADVSANSDQHESVYNSFKADERLVG